MQKPKESFDLIVWLMLALVVALCYTSVLGLEQLIKELQWLRKF